MSLKQVFLLIEKIKLTSSTNDKIDLLKTYLQDLDFKQVMELTYDSNKQYKINKMPKMIPLDKDNLFHNPEKITNDKIFTYLNKLASQRGVSDEEKKELTKLASKDKETYSVVQMIVRKDCKAGFSEKLLNKALPNFIKIVPYCRCSTEKKLDSIKFEEGVYIQEKVDGLFLNVIVEDKKITLLSRNGNQINQLDKIVESIKKTNLTNTALMGELIIEREGKVLPRKIGNGIFNSAIQGTAEEKDLKGAKVRLWDYVSVDSFWKGEDSTPYSKRLKKLKTFLKENNPKYFELVDTRKISSLQEALDIYKEFRSEGKEGAIVKTKDAVWKNHTSPKQVKLKNISEAELRIVGWSYGEKDTKYENKLGSLQCESDDGTVKVSISGFTDAERDMDWNKEIGSIVSIEYESLITDKKRKDVYSLYLPRFCSIRRDRNETDTLNDLLKR